MRLELKGLGAILEQPVSGLSLAVFRFAFGALLVVLFGHGYITGWIEHDFIQAHFLFNYFPHLAIPPGKELHWLFVTIIGSAACVSLGLFFRTAIIVLFLSFTIFFLLDKAQYQNHYYLICLLSFLLSLMPAERCLSLDVWRSGQGLGLQNTIPIWSLWILRCQFCLVYFYGALAKANADWLRGQPQHDWLLSHSFGTMLEYSGLFPVFVYAITYGGILVDLTIPTLLLFKQTYCLGALISLVFHSCNAFLFDIDIFPYLMIASLSLFASPNWPVHILERLSFCIPKLWTIKAPVIETESFTQPKPLPSRDSLLYCVLLLYLVIQIILPLRHYLYQGNTSWTELGHHFAWRMMLRNKATCLRMWSVDPNTHLSKEIQLKDYLTEKQARAMKMRPDMILQFAHYLAYEAVKLGRPRPQIKVEAFASLNGRPWQYLIDPTVNLALPEKELPANWIVPLI